MPLISKHNIKNTLSGASWIWIVILVLLSFAIYWRTLSFGFVQDDYGQDRYYSLKEIISTFYGSWDQTYISSDFYRPAVVISYAINHFICKTNALGYHLTNIILNMVNVILVYFIMRKNGTSLIFSFVAAILFLLIPYNSVSVTWISHRGDIIMTLFYLSSFLAFLFYVTQQKVFFYYLSIFCFIFSLMSKEMAVTLPFILFTYSYLQLKRLKIKLIIPYFAILLAYMLFRFLIFKGLGGYEFEANFPAYVSIPLRYGLTILRTYFIFPYTDFLCLLIYLTLIFILACFSIIHFKFFENKNNLFFAFAWIGITVLPLYAAPVFRLLYLPSVGLAILLSLICSDLYKNNFKYPVIFILIGLGVILATANMKYQNIFNPASNYVLEADKVLYNKEYNQLDKEQQIILEQKLERYGLLSEAKGLIKQREDISEPKMHKTTVTTYIKRLFMKKGWTGVISAILPLYNPWG